MATQSPSSDTPNPPRRPLLTRQQCIEIAVLPTFIGLFLFVMLHIKYDYVRSLWETPLGIKMSVSGVLLLGVGMVAITLLYVVQNQAAPEEGSGKRLLLSLTFFLAYVVFFVPVALIILIGPAVIQIAEGFR